MSISKLIIAGFLYSSTCNAGFIQENVMKPKKYQSSCAETNLSLDDYKKEKQKFFSSLDLDCQTLPTAVVCAKGKQILSFNYFETANECNTHFKQLK